MEQYDNSDVFESVLWDETRRLTYQNVKFNVGLIKASNQKLLFRIMQVAFWDVLK